MKRLRLLARAAAVTIQQARQDGLMRTARRAFRTARIFGLSNALQRAETAGGQWHWYWLELGRNKPRALPAGMELRRCRRSDIPLFAELAPIMSRDAERRFDAGGALWMVVSHDRALFACWTFTERSPTGQANQAWLQLPAGTAHVQDI